MVYTEKILQIFIILFTLIVFSGCNMTCVSRRCLAEEFRRMKLFSAPQVSDCVVNVNLTSIQYQTLSVDTKAMRISSRIKISMEWNDPDLAWSESVYGFNKLVLPYDEIWTPYLTVDNAVYMDIKPVCKDIVVRSNGNVNYAIFMYTTVGCGINLFTYPFVEGTCPVAINGWNQSSCGLQLQYGTVSSVGAGRGEWQTLSVQLYESEDTNNHNYIEVIMSTNPFNAMVSLVLPSALIMFVDLVSFALPLDGGKRSSFKITLVLSFTMFLLILTNNLPDGQCSPLLRYHFCFCMIVLVTSMLTSMIFTKLAADGSIQPFKRQKPRTSDHSVSYVLPKISLTKEGDSLEKIVSFVENMDKKQMNIKKKQDFANKLDKICFWLYLSLDIIYGVCAIAFTKTETCNVDNLDFWS